MHFSNSFSLISCTISIVIALSLGASDSQAEYSVTVSDSPRYKMQLTAVESTPNGTVITGEITRPRFGSRSPVSGQVVIEVFDADGISIRKDTTSPSPYFVGKGLRPSTFAFALDRQLPPDARIAISFRR